MSIRYLSNLTLALVAAFVVGVWLVVASRVFAHATVVWLGFSAAAALAVLAVAGLTLHELEDERVIHAVDMTSHQQRSAGQTAELAS